MDIPEDEPYCHNCGSENLSYDDNYGGTLHWDCKDCGQHITTLPSLTE